MKKFSMTTTQNKNVSTSEGLTEKTKEGGVKNQLEGNVFYNINSRLKTTMKGSFLCPAVKRMCSLCF